MIARAKYPTPLPEHQTRMGPAEVAAAVFCGCTTPERLAREWSITEGLARALLHGAHEAGLVEIRGGAWVPLKASEIREPRLRAARGLPHKRA